jgi:hypothetical protein
MPQQASDELVSVKTQGSCASVAVVGVAHAHEALGVERQHAVLRHGPAPDIPGQIKGYAACVVIGRLNLDIPVLEIELADGGQPMRQALHGRKAQMLGDQQGLEASQQLPPKQNL